MTLWEPRLVMMGLVLLGFGMGYWAAPMAQTALANDERDYWHDQYMRMGGYAAMLRLACIGGGK